MKNITFKHGEISIDIRFSPEENTIWMSQGEMSILFSRDKSNIGRLIKRIDFGDRHLQPLVAQNATTGVDGKTYKMSLYNLEAIRLIGNRINPSLTQEFYDWCMKNLERENNGCLLDKSNIVRFNNGTIELDVTINIEEDTVYLEKEQLVILFDTTRQNIDYHINNIYESCELNEKATCKEILQVQNEGKRKNQKVTGGFLTSMVSL